MTKATETDAVQAMKTLSAFISRGQLSALAKGCRGEEKQFFFDKLVEMAERVTAMPKTYETDGQGEEAIVHLHYFWGGMDWYIIEKDVETEDEPGQHQAFGLADLGDGGELGYISIVELVESGMELDLHFEPRTLAAVRARRLTK